MGLDILAVIEETRTKGLVVRNLNVPFITLIPKCSNPMLFNEFQPISLCHIAHKVITKIMANRLKQGLFEGVLKELIWFPLQLDDSRCDRYRSRMITLHQI